MKKLLWLDDVRNPWDLMWLNYITKNIVRTDQIEITWVKNYNEFVDEIVDNGLPDIVSFDHDLADEHYVYSPTEEIYKQADYMEATGYDCAKFLVDYCQIHEKDLPQWHCHSWNPMGKKFIISLLSNFNKHSDGNTD